MTMAAVQWSLNRLRGVGEEGVSGKREQIKWQDERTRQLNSCTGIAVRSATSFCYILMSAKSSC